MHFSISEIKKYYGYLIILNIFLSVFIFYQLFYSRYYWKSSEEKKFIVEQGKNLDEIIEGLYNDDIIPAKLLFKVAVKISGKEGQIISKSYLFKTGLNNLELIDLLTDKNLTQFTKITIPEGYTIKQIGKLIEKKLSLSGDIFYKETRNDSLISLLGLKGKIRNLEGFLFPDTYEVQINTDERKLVFLLFNEFRQKIIYSGIIGNDLQDADTGLLKIITLASIVQGETKLEEEMPVIAGVYTNRISKGMKLEADPTIQYILPDGPRRLLYDDLKINSPYNTYLNKGLPPGPINNPGISAIKAALDPDDHNYFFFVATGKGGHKFSGNYQQHMEAVKEYRAQLKNDSNKKK